MYSLTHYLSHTFTNSLFLTHTVNNSIFFFLALSLSISHLLSFFLFLSPSMSLSRISTFGHLSSSVCLSSYIVITLSLSRFLTGANTKPRENWPVHWVRDGHGQRRIGIPHTLHLPHSCWPTNRWSTLIKKSITKPIDRKTDPENNNISYSRDWAFVTECIEFELEHGTLLLIFLGTLARLRERVMKEYDQVRTV